MRICNVFVAYYAVAGIAAQAQSAIIHAGEEIFTINVRGGLGVAFKGSYLVSRVGEESKISEVTGTVPAEFKVTGKSVYLSFQNQSKASDPEIKIGTGGRLLDMESPRAGSIAFLEVELSKGGSAFKRQRTYAPYGIVSLASAKPAGGTMRQGSIEVDGSIKYALVTSTSETGDTEQQLVPVPFRKEIYPHEGWIVGVVAQKTKVTRLDPLHSGQIEILDDGHTGLMHVAIRVNGRILSESQTSMAFGVASATATAQ